MHAAAAPFAIPAWCADLDCGAIAVRGARPGQTDSAVMCDTTTAAALGSASRPAEEQFVLGDDDDDLPGYSAVGSRPPSVFSVDARSRDLSGKNSSSSETRVHYIRADDSLNSVALAYRISVRRYCSKSRSSCSHARSLPSTAFRRRR